MTSISHQLSHPIGDSLIMFRRSLVRMKRYPSMTIMLIAFPLLVLLLFVYVFGGTLGAGLPGGGSGADGRADYLAYVTPALVLMAAASAAQGTAISVAMDRTEGIVARLRTMPIAPSSILGGHVLGSLVQSVLGMAAILVVAIALGFRPAADPAQWLTLLALLVLVALALTWLTVALGLLSRSVETASNTPTFLMILPFLSSGFVPTESMPAGLSWFAEHQPFTPMIEGVRGLLAGEWPWDTLALAAGWCVLIVAVGYLWARRLFRPETTQAGR
jgi:ABC-2 type transport system permease protein